MNKEVSFQIAKLLKEKEFDEYCLFIWNEENLEEPYYYAEHYEMICLRIHYYGDIPMINNSYIEKYATYVEKDEVTEEVYELLVAPTISDVVMWLYKEHGIWISVFSTDDVTMFSYKISCRQGHNYSPNFNSPTEAYEAAIVYTLNNLI
jgi:hypothetical protein